VIEKTDNPNLAILEITVEALGDLSDSLVFVGGCATGLLLTRVRANQIRATKDVDVVTRVATIVEYHSVEARLSAKGFKPDTSPDAPICRWLARRTGSFFAQPETMRGHMGLDTVELIIKVEKLFGIEIPDRDAARLVTVGDLHGYVVGELRRRGRLDGDAGTIYAQLQEIICRQLGVKPGEVVPSARFVDDLGAD